MYSGLCINISIYIRRVYTSDGYYSRVTYDMYIHIAWGKSGGGSSLVAKGRGMVYIYTYRVWVLKSEVVREQKDTLLKWEIYIIDNC